ncbi:MAG: hypothetical protein EKK37_13690 [Sphingobacteriales bacterium]|nr:MAG: hypothetical protein EKK37_13690 [Sphingobacteriales bacterium]
MKKYLLITFLFIAAFTQLKAQQDDPEENAKIEALKIAFISKKLDLSPEEAQRFWPVYNQYFKEMRQLIKDQKESDKDDVLDKEQKVIDLRKRYRDQFIKIVGQQRMNKLFNAERDFRRILINRIKNRPVRPGGVLKRG